MKKILSAVLSLMMIVSCASFVSAKEAVIEGTNEVAVAIDDVVVTDATAKINVPINIKFADGFGGIIGSTLQFSFDTDKLAFDKASSKINYADAAAGDTARVNISKNNVITLQFISADLETGLNTNGLYATLVFDAVAGATGDAVIEITNAKFSKVGNTACTNNFTNGKVTLPAAEVPKYDVTFDANLDGVADPTTMADVESGTEITLPELEDTAFFRFQGWKVDGNDTVYTDKYTVTADTTLIAVWERIVYYTVTYSEDETSGTAYAEGSVITLPTLTNADLVFLGWKANGEGDVLAGGSQYTVNNDVQFVAVWKSAGKVFISDAGADTNNGLTAETPVKTMPKAQELLAQEDNETLVVVGTHTICKEQEEIRATTETIGVAGKTITIMGYDDTAIFCMDRLYNAWDDARVVMAGPIVFKNIKIQGENNDGYLATNGYKLVFEDTVSEVEGKRPQKIVFANNAALDKIQELIINGGYLNVLAGSTGNSASSSVLAVTVNGGRISEFNIAKGNYGNPKHTGIYDVTINGGEITKINMNSTGTGAANSYKGVRYFTLNDGTVGDIITTGSATYQNNSTEKKSMDTACRTGVTVFEINKNEIVTGTIGLGASKTVANQLDKDDATRVVIYNNSSFVEGQVTDPGAYVMNVKNGKLQAVVTDFFDSGLTAEAWVDSVELLGFRYELPEGVEGINAVEIGDEIILLEDLEDSLVPVPEEAGVCDVEFIKIHLVTIHGADVMTYYVPDGGSISLRRLENDGDLKHIGWATTEDAETAQYNHTIEFTPTEDVSLYPVWAEAVYFTAIFETNHGEAPAAISIIDDDEDGKADEAIMFPGYDGKQDGHFTFTGWMDTAYVGAPEGTTVPKYNAGDILFLDGNKTFIATWEEDPKGTVTYRNESGEAPEAVTDYVGTEIVIAECPTVEGFEFLGWIADGVTYQPGEKYTIEDEFGIAFTAKWGVKVAVDANGAKGEAPVIGGAIGEEIDLPGCGNLTYVNHTFLGWSTEADGEVITGKYTVNPEETLYAIWEEAVEDAAIIETKVTYYTGTGSYLVDVYFYGKDANTVAFGYSFGENLELKGFTPATGLAVPHETLEVCGVGYYANVVADEQGGKIEGASAQAGNGIHLGTIEFTFNGTSDEYSEDDLADNVDVTVPGDAVDNVSSEEYFLYTPAVSGLEVIGLPVVFDEAFTYEIIDVVYTVTGTVKLVRDSEDAPKNFAKLHVFSAESRLIKTLTIEDENTFTNEDGFIDVEIQLPAGTYFIIIEKQGYLASEIMTINIEDQEGSDQPGFVPEGVSDSFTTELIAGNVVEDNEIIDLLDFVAITSSFGRDDIDEDDIIALDINEDGFVTVDDLLYVKVNFGESVLS